MVSSGRERSALALLVPGVLADDADDVAALNDLAILTEALDGGSDFHGYFSG